MWNIGSQVAQSMETTFQTGGGFHGAKLKMLVSLLLVSWAISVSSTVTYDHKAIVINGQRRLLFSGSIHYPRSTPDMWPGLIEKAKEGGLEVIQTYVFWNGHEPSPGKYYFEDRYDLVRFIRLVQRAGLYVHLRIGPFVCAEWNFGGFPVWLKFVPGIEFRTDNEPFKNAMKGFTEKIVNMMKAERLFESQGGPIILSQIENEYGPVEWEIGAPGRAYTQWAASMAVGLGTGVPWVMCKQDHVPDPIINTCNDFYCEGFEPEKPTRPKMWTELWTGWFTEFGLPVPHRPAEDMAFAVLRFLANRGTFVNYYMYHGGTNFERTSGGPFIATSYDYDAPLDEYGLTTTKWSHMRDLHKAIKLCEPALLSTDPTIQWLGKGQTAYVFKSGSGCAAFLANYDWKFTIKVNFWNTEYELPPWSISVLPDCKSVAYNSAQLGSHSPVIRMAPVINSFSWQSHAEEIVISYERDTFVKKGLQEQISLTWDKTDYLWYTTDITVNNDEAFLRNGKSPLLTVYSAGHVLHVYLNAHLIGTVYGSQNNPKLTYSGHLNLRAGVNKLSLLSVAVGLPNVGVHFEKWNVGIIDTVTLDGMNSGKWDLKSWDWSYKIGLKGEDLAVYTHRGSSSLRWNGGGSLVTRQPMQWYQTIFNAPGGSAPLALDMHTMGKGQVWINGRHIGRHWPAYTAHGDCAGCYYAGPFNDKKCRTNCGEASQRWYHVPRSWLFPTGNILTVFEEFGGDPHGISLVERIAT